MCFTSALFYLGSDPDKQLNFKKYPSKKPVFPFLKAPFCPLKHEFKLYVQTNEKVLTLGTLSKQETIRHYRHVCQHSCYSLFPLNCLTRQNLSTNI